MVKRDTLKIYDVKRPESILNLGLRHAEQISLLEKVRLGGVGRAIYPNWARNEIVFQLWALYSYREAQSN